MKKPILTFVFMIAMVCYTNMYAQKPAIVASNEPGWTHIGQTTANFNSQDESIMVLGADEFTAIKLKVTEAPLHLESLQVFYESGEMEEIKVQKDISVDEETRVMKLKHPDRDISKVAFRYKTSANADGDKADVALYGLKTNQPAGEDSYRDEKAEIKEDAREAGNEVKEETREAGDEVKEETREAKDEINEEAREAGDEVKEEAREAGDEVKEEAREAKDEVKEEANEAEKDAQSVGDKISEGVNEAAATIKDEKVEGKVGPGGETVYFDDDEKYYYVNNEGDKVHITKAQLKDKPKDK